MKLNLTQLTLAQVGSDGCTGWIDGWWRQCCVDHDFAYAEGASKWLADLALWWCVSTSGTEWWQQIVSAGMGLVMLIGVGAFGWLFYKKGNQKNDKEKTY